jgi:uncharacterized membrane protein YciS (DUF1049 family)
MNVVYNIMLIFGLTFVIGMVVAAVIWLLYTTMTAESFPRIKRGEQYSEMKRLKHKKIKSA